MDLTLGQALLAGWAAVAVLQVFLSFREWVTKDASLVDVGWAAGIALIALAFPFLVSAEGPRIWFVAALGFLWSLRLALFLYLNRVRGKPEDGRYRRMREGMGSKAHLGFFVFFQFQATWSVLFAIPFLAAAYSTREFPGLLDFAGLLVWLAAVGGEAMADAQLARFRANPANKGQTCRVGLWNYSRHPNYFFEWLHWWAYVLIGIGSAYWYLTLLGPLLMFLFLFFVTGIPHTEKQALASRGESYREYQRTTSMFFPWPPKRGA
jgi:steroid 5-alpha reductase family enzyme